MKAFNITLMMALVCGVWFIAGYMAGYDDTHPITMETADETDD